MDSNTLVVLDACVLAPFSVCDLLLRLAEEPRLYLPRWSEEILTEVHRTQVAKLGWPERLADYWRQELTAAFPEALVTGYEALIDQCHNRDEDRHVLAASIKGQAATIVTFNMRHFPASALESYSIQAVHPSRFLVTLFDSDPDAVNSRLTDIASKRGVDPVEVLRRLRGPLPAFAKRVAEANAWIL